MTFEDSRKAFRETFRSFSDIQFGLRQVCVDLDDDQSDFDFRNHEWILDFSSAGFFANTISNTSRVAPMTIALSATLKAGHW